MAPWQHNWYLDLFCLFIFVNLLRTHFHLYPRPYTYIYALAAAGRAIETYYSRPVSNTHTHNNLHAQHGSHTHTAPTRAHKYKS